MHSIINFLMVRKIVKPKVSTQCALYSGLHPILMNDQLRVVICLQLSESLICMLLVS